MIAALSKARFQRKEVADRDDPLSGKVLSSFAFALSVIRRNTRYCLTAATTASSPILAAIW